MRILRKAKRWTPLVAINPKHFCSTSPRIEQLDIERWSEEEYAWHVDGWKGMRDWAKPPEQTIEEGVGDCEDYALVAASWELVHSNRPLYIAYMFDSWYPYPRHMVCQANDLIYSSGSITKETIEEYTVRSEYDTFFRRRIPR